MVLVWFLSGLVKRRVYVIKKRHYLWLLFFLYPLNKRLDALHPKSTTECIQKNVPLKSNIECIQIRSPGNGNAISIFKSFWAAASLYLSIWMSVYYGNWHLRTVVASFVYKHLVIYGFSDTSCFGVWFMNGQWY